MTSLNIPSPRILVLDTFPNGLPHGLLQLILDRLQNRRLELSLRALLFCRRILNSLLHVGCPRIHGCPLYNYSVGLDPRGAGRRR